ncbi:MAG: DUF1573 domain-containing protein [Muribaculaceae bacterium]|jgi:hypothetical protein|nr:DUF1573 domain-containing protein [Muribaculaceae bacterium]
MKRILFAIVALIISVASLSADDGYAQATFPNKNHDFGIIKEAKGPVSCTFEFVNTGDKPLIIIEALASCGCTRPEYPTRPIAPGKKGKIKVTYSPIGRPGSFKKTIKIKTNGREKKTVLIIEGSVIPMNK